MKGLFTLLLTLLLCSTAYASVDTDVKVLQAWSKHKDAIVAAAVTAKVSPATMAAIAYNESRFIAKDLYQFKPKTWRVMIQKYGHKYGFTSKTRSTNARANALMAAEYFNENRALLAQRLGRPVSDADAYIAHFLGAGGAVKLLKAKPNKLARDIVPAAARANKTLFYSHGRALTVAQFKRLMSDKLKQPRDSYGQQAKEQALLTHGYVHSYT